MATSKKYNVDTLTIEDVQELLRNGDDKTNNQLRIDKDGYAYLYQGLLLSELENVQFRMECFCSNNGYVGKNAAEDKEFVLKVYNFITKGWKENYIGHCAHKF